jgi:hypothetical protein
VVLLYYYIYYYILYIILLYYYTYIIILYYYYIILFLPLLSSPILISSSSPLCSIPSSYLPSSHSFYTCRYLHILIYILFQYSSLLLSFLFPISSSLLTHLLLFLSHPISDLYSQYSTTFILYLSVLTYTYLYSRLFPSSQISDPARSIGVDG